MPDFAMPSLGADMDEGTVVKWLVGPGSSVHRGDIVAEVETQKGSIELEIFQDGVVEEILVPEGTRVVVGTALARLAGPDGEVKAPAPAGPTPAAPAPAVSATPAPPMPEPAEIAVARGRVSPRARRLAARLEVDLDTVTGTGPGGAVGEADVEAAAAEAALAPPEGADRAGAMRQAIAALMARSKREIPHYYLSTHVDLSRALAWLTESNLARPIEERLLPAALLLKATALALREVPELNGSFDGRRFQPGPGIHVGVAISLREGGLVAPAIHDLDRLALVEVMAALRDLVGRGRSGRLRSSEMSDPTITVTNLGDQGVEAVLGVIYPPQVALVGFGKVVERPWAEAGMIGARPVVQVTLSGDHRVSDGHRGAVFLQALDRLLQQPEKL